MLATSTSTGVLRCREARILSLSSNTGFWGYRLGHLPEPCISTEIGSGFTLVSICVGCDDPQAKTDVWP